MGGQMQAIRRAKPPAMLSTPFVALWKVLDKINSIEQLARTTYIPQYHQWPFCQFLISLLLFSISVSLKDCNANVLFVRGEVRLLLSSCLLCSLISAVTFFPERAFPLLMLLRVFLRFGDNAGDWFWIWSNLDSWRDIVSFTSFPSWNISMCLFK